MRTEEQLLKKKKKKKNRFARFLLVLVLLLIVIIFVFWSISNPSFLKNTRNSLMSLFSTTTISEDSSYEYSQGTAYDSGEVSAGSSQTEEQLSSPGGQSQDTLLTEPGNGEPAEGAQVNDNAETEEVEASGGSLNFWNKIINFFKNKIGSDEKDFPSRIELKVYFASLGEESLFSYENRTISAGNPEIAVENAVKELLKGPMKSFNYPVIPPGSELLDVEIYENFAKIDFSQEFLENSLESGILDEYVIYTIVNTVTQIPEIDGAIFLIEGNRIKIYGNVDLSIPAIKNEKYIEVEES